MHGHISRYSRPPSIFEFSDHATEAHDQLSSPCVSIFFRCVAQALPQAKREQQQQQQNHIKNDPEFSFFIFLFQVVVVVVVVVRCSVVAASPSPRRSFVLVPTPTQHRYLLHSIGGYVRTDVGEGWG